MKRRIFGTVILGISAAVLVACGGGGSDAVVSTNMTVTPAKGAIYGGAATIYSANGTTSLGTADTGATSGTAVINVGNYSGVAFVKVAGKATGATYYDEKLATTATFGATASLVSAVPAITAGSAGDAGVTPFTTMAAKLAGVDISTLGSAGAVPAGFTKATAIEGGARVLLALGLPSSYNIFAKPTPATAAAPTPTDPLSALLAKMAANSSSNALTLFNDIISSTPKATVGTDGTTTVTFDSTATAAFTAFKTAVDTAAASLPTPITTTASKLAPSSTELTAAKDALTAAVAATTTTAAATTTTAAATTTTVASTTTTTAAASGSGSGTGSGSGSGSGTGTGSF